MSSNPQQSTQPNLMGFESHKSLEYFMNILHNLKLGIL